MPTPLRHRTVLRLLCAALCLAAAPASRAILSAPSAAAPDPLDKISHLPESNPYRAALVAYLSLPQSDRSALQDWFTHGSDYDISPPPTLTPEQRALARQLTQSLAQTASAPATSPKDWPPQYDPQQPDEPTAITFPEIGSLRDLARIATKVAGESPPAEAITLYAATAKLGRDTRQGATLIQKITGIAIDDIAQLGVSQRLGEFTPQELETLSAAWKSLPAGADLTTALESERNLMFRHYSEKILLPGVKAYLAAGEPSPDTFANDSDADAAIRRLRLSALVDFGDGEKQITLEKRDTGESFTVTQKRPAEGVELLDFDIPGQRATIRVHGREALVNLQSKEIVAQSDALKKLLLFLKQMPFTDRDQKSWLGPGFQPFTITRQAWLDRIKNHPGGPDVYFAEALENYDRSFARQLAGADQADLPDPANPQADDPDPDPILALLTPTVSKVARSLHAADVNATMLEAAIRHRLGQDAQAPADPWSATSPDEAASPFVFTATPDGGFTLASRYQRRKDEPVTYKFAAPDAGTVRPKPPAPSPAAP